MPGKIKIVSLSSVDILFCVTLTFKPWQPKKIKTSQDSSSEDLIHFWTRSWCPDHVRCCCDTLRASERADKPENPCVKFRPGAQAGAHIPAGTIPGRAGSGPEVESEERWTNGGLTRHWSQLRPVTRRLQKQSPLTGSHWELPDTVPRLSQRQAGGGPAQSKEQKR